MLKNYFLCLFLLGNTIAFPALAENASTRAALQQRLVNLDTFQATFVQEVKSASGTLLQEASGTLSIAKPTLLDWRVTAPDETRLLSKGDDVYLIDPFLEQVSIYDLNTMTENNPLLLLLSNDDKQWDNFVVTQQLESGKTTFSISANSTSAMIQTLTLVFTNTILNEMSFVDSQQQLSRFTFLNAQMNSTLPSDTFSYDIPDYFTIDDQRVITNPVTNTP